MNIKEIKRMYKEKTTNPQYREFWINIIRQKLWNREHCNFPQCKNKQREDTIFCEEHQQQYENSKYYE